MKKTKASLLLQGEQAMEDKKIVDSAGLHEMEVMPAFEMIGALRFLQDLCRENGKAIHEITPELIIHVIKNQSRFVFN